MTDKNRNLIVRVVTAFVLLPLIIWLIILGDVWFALLIGVASAMAALELNLMPGGALIAEEPGTAEEKLSRKERKKAKAALREEVEEIERESAQISGAGLASVGAAFLLPMLSEISFGIASFKLVISALVIIAFADALFFEEKLEDAPRRVGLAVLGAAYPGLLLSALVRLRQHDNGIWWIILTLVVTWWNDTGAYFAGRALGKHKLYPRISPSKTWEGAIGGMVASTVGAVLVKQFWMPEVPYWGAVLIGVGASILGPLGDLSESLLKRGFGVKDSGKLLPGHGGMLDRIDALLFNAPFVLLCARLLAGAGG